MVLTGVGLLDNVKLGSARLGGGGDSVTTIEQCQCPDGYVGQFCESCAPGFHRQPAGGGPYSRCVPCNCNGHSDNCDANTGTVNHQ
jgi:laminin gamma 1